ncbi:hypothetical protein BDN67DRAFT_642762 [Paxillus ammoniavirescens]|nr:hypothetical protein BDN67DRAFT_642762 [Paxillus ammoniavirescens]
MNLTRDVKLVDLSHKDAILLAVCASVGGAGLVALMIYVFVMYRRRKRGVIGGQDTLARPFGTVAPAPTVASTSMVSLGNTRSRMGLSTPIPPRLNVDVSLPVLDISPRNNSESDSGGYGNRTEKVFPQGRKPSRTRTVPAPVSYSHSQPGAGTSRSTLHHRPSDSSMHQSPDRYASPYQSPDRSRAYAQSPTRSGSHTHLSHSNPSLPIRAQPPRPVEMPTPRSPSAQERHSAKRTVYISRSASDLHRAASSAPRYRTPRNDTYAPSSQHAHHDYAHDSRIDTVTRPANQLRHYYSASPIVHVPPGLEHDARHQDSGIMHELPPPYHELMRSDEGAYR